jgi:deoxyribose-phosphate aldolase
MNSGTTDNSEAGLRLAGMIDHTLLKPEAGFQDIERLCGEALRYGFASVCVNPAMLPVVVERLSGTRILPCTVAGFPLGATTTPSKAYEAGEAAQSGAREIDMVLAVWAIKQKAYSTALDDIKAVVRSAGSSCGVKVILETCLLTDEEKVIACKVALDAGARFVKTSTGLNSGGATTHDVALMRTTVGAKIGVKAAGGIKTLANAEAMVKAGATRIGTSSGITIVSKP